MGKEIVNHRFGVLTIVNVAEILIASEICIYLPSEHQHDEDGDVLKFMRCGGREDEKKINGISHCTLRDSSHVKILACPRPRRRR